MSEATAPSDPAARELPIVFRATGSEYFRIWIVNLLLTIVTIGIYSAWAKVRRLRYFYGSTSLDGFSFEYHGRPTAILKGRLIVVGVYALFLGAVRLWPSIQIAALPLFVFGLPWVVVRSRLFQMRMTSWRGLRFNFHGRYGGALGAITGWMLLAMVTLFILWPLALWKTVNFLVTNTAYGSQRFSFRTTKGRFYEFCLVSLGIAVGAAFVAGIVAALIGVSVAGLAGLPAAGSPRVPPSPAAAASLVLVVFVFYTVIALLVGAYYRASFLNASVGGAEVGSQRIVSRLRALPLLGILVTNVLAIIVTLGLYYPWAKVRLMRYQLANTAVLAEGDLGQFAADSEAGVSAVGEEAGDFFDVDFGF